MGPRRIVVIAFVVLVALLAGGCRVDTTTTITLDDHGGGTVTLRVRLDPQAVQLVERGGGHLQQRINLDDLHKSGWSLSGWQSGSDGSAAIKMSHAFRNGKELAAVVDSISGTHGLLRDPHVTRARGFVQDRDGVSVVADLRSLKNGVRNDKELSSRLQAAGIDVKAVDFVLAAQLRKAFSMGITLSVPRNKTRQFTITPGTQDTVNLSSSSIHWNRFMMLMIGAMLVFLALLLYLSASISARRRHSRELEFAAARSRRRGGSEPLM